MKLKELSEKVQATIGGEPMVEVTMNEYGSHVLIWDGQEDDIDRSLVATGSGSPLDVACGRANEAMDETTLVK